MPRPENIPVLLPLGFVLAACIWIGINAWVLANLLTTPIPSNHLVHWFRRFLGILPLLFA